MVVRIVRNWKKWIDKLLTIAFVVCMLIVAWLLLQVVGISSFRVSTDSMQPTLQPGDNILVNKTIMGTRIFNIWE